MKNHRMLVMCALVALIAIGLAWSVYAGPPCGAGRGNATCPLTQSGCPMATVCPMAENGCPMAQVGCPVAQLGCPILETGCPLAQDCPLAQYCPLAKGSPQFATTRQELQKKLNITVDQKRRLAQIAEECHAMTKDLWAGFVNRRDNLNRLVDDPQASDEAIADAVRELSEVQVQLQIACFTAQHRMRMVYTSEQKAMLYGMAGSNLEYGAPAPGANIKAR